jgi:hypothetical protein
MYATIDTIKTITRYKGSGSIEDGRVIDRKIFKCRVVCRNLSVT